MKDETEGQRLKKIIDELGLKQNTFAQSIGLDASQISRKYMYVLMVAVHNINIDYLKTGKGSMFLNSSTTKELIKRELASLNEEQAKSVLAFIRMLKKN